MRQTNTNTDETTDSTTAPQIARTQTCARASVVGRGTGVGEAFASVAAGAVKVSAAACGDAVSNAVSGLCAGADPMATIFGVTQACASALADVYTRAVTNATALPVEDPTGLRPQEEEDEARARWAAGGGGESGDGAPWSPSPSSALWWPALKGPGGAAGGASSADDGATTSPADPLLAGEQEQQQQQQRRGFLTACASGCANAQASAEAFAQAAACGVAKGTDQCAAAMAQVKTRAFSSAFVKTAAAAWSSACARGYGRAQGGGEQVARAAAASIAKVTAQLAATACSTCAGCKCKPLPRGFDWSDPSDYASASASLADGRTAVAKAAASATVAYCETPADLRPQALNASVDGVLDALAEVLTTASGNLSATSGAQGGVGNAWACGGTSLEARLGAAKDAYAAAVQDAAAIVFGSWCPRAAARMTKLAAVNQDLTETLISEQIESCSVGSDDGGAGGGIGGGGIGGGIGGGGIGGGIGGGGGPRNKTVRSVVAGHKPWVDAVHDALTDAEACGCRPRPLCTTCTGAADRMAKLAERAGKEGAADALLGIVAPAAAGEEGAADDDGGGVVGDGGGGGVEGKEAGGGGEGGGGVPPGEGGAAGGGKGGKEGEQQRKRDAAGGGGAAGAAKAAASAAGADAARQAGLDLTALAARAARAAKADGGGGGGV